MARPLAIKDFLLTEDGEKHLAKLKLQGKSEKDINLDLLPFGKGEMCCPYLVNCWNTLRA
jgi:hypothetical protein